MLIIEARSYLAELRSGRLDASDAASLEEVRPSWLVAELQVDHPVVFQKRTIGNKQEIGMAEVVNYVFGGKSIEGSRYPHSHLVTEFRECVFVSFYGESISELTTASSLQARFAYDEEHKKCLVLTMNRCFKLEKGPDGWSVKKLRRRPMRISESALKERGWQLDVAFAGGIDPWSTESKS